jgi:3-hydroxybutyrate dehydrogenase
LSEIETRRALVTGAGRGIGRSIALALAEAGTDVVVTARSKDEIEDVADEIKNRGRNSLALVCDVTAVAQVEQMAAEVTASFGTINILVNNAGSGKSARFLNHPNILWHDMIAVNLNSVYYVTKAFAPGMVEAQWGRIINIASVASKVGGKYIAAYTAAKHGVLGLTRALAVELVKDGITVNAICPGYVDTPMTDGNIENMVSRTGMNAEKAREFLAQSSPQNRLIEADEVAALAVYLVSEAARGINGQAINIDGGAVMF